jgi:hypothetical protein
MSSTESSAPLLSCLELTYRGCDDTVAFACSKCGAMSTPGMFGGGPHAREAAQRMAVEHCMQRYCRCGAKISKSQTVCSACWSADQKERDDRKFSLSNKIYALEYGDPVFWEGHEGSMGDGYFSNVEEVIEYCADNDIDPPTHVWACSNLPFSIDTDSILESAFEQHFEGARDMLSEEARQELEQFLQNWCQKQGIESWQTDYRRSVILGDENGGVDGNSGSDSPDEGSEEE